MPSTASSHPLTRLPQDYQAILQRRGLDCRGWALVLCGHSLGAGIAALLAPHFKDWWPGATPGCAPAGEARLLHAPCQVLRLPRAQQMPF